MRKQVAEALVAIQAGGVVDRAPKPSNIYLVPEEEEGRGPSV